MRLRTVTVEWGQLMGDPRGCGRGRVYLRSLFYFFLAQPLVEPLRWGLALRAGLADCDSLIAAWAAANRAMGTRKGEQLT